VLQRYNKFTENIANTIFRFSDNKILFHEYEWYQSQFNIQWEICINQIDQAMH